MKISAIVVTYNRLKILKKCLSNLLLQDYSLNNIIVINNNSSDGTKDFLNHIKNTKIIPINVSKNIGGAGGFSLGIKEAFERSNSDYFWIMDDDAVVDKASLFSLVKAVRELHNKFGFLCSNVRWGSQNIPVNIPETSLNWPIFLPGNLIKVKCASFVSLFIPRIVVSKVGLPISQMFIWGDDYEYTLRISSRFPSYFVSNSIIIHDSLDNNNNKLSTKETIYNSNRISFYKYKFRNYLYDNKIHLGYIAFLKCLLKDFLILVKIPFYSKNKRLKRFIISCSSILHGLFFNPTIHFPK